MPVVFKNRQPTAKNRAIVSPDGRQVHAGFTRHPRIRLPGKMDLIMAQFLGKINIFDKKY